MARKKNLLSLFFPVSSSLGRPAGVRLSPFPMQEKRGKQQKNAEKLLFTFRPHSCSLPCSFPRINKVAGPSRDKNGGGGKCCWLSSPNRPEMERQPPRGEMMRNAKVAATIIASFTVHMLLPRSRSEIKRSVVRIRTKNRARRNRTDDRSFG